MDTELKILGKLTGSELQTLKNAQRTISESLLNLEVLRAGLQYLTNKAVADHHFPNKIRLDYETGIVYNVPEIGDPNVGSHA